MTTNPTTQGKICCTKDFPLPEDSGKFLHRHFSYFPGPLDKGRIIFRKLVQIYIPPGGLCKENHIRIIENEDCPGWLAPNRGIPTHIAK